MERLVVKDQYIMVGDLNIDLMKDSFYAKNLTTEMSYLSMKQYIDKPTRVMKDSKTLIDLVLANSKVNCKIHVKPKITDHLWINIEFIINNVGKKYRKFGNRDYTRFHIGELCKEIEKRIQYKDDLETQEQKNSFKV